MDEEYDVILLGTGLKVIEKKQEKKTTEIILCDVCFVLGMCFSWFTWC